MSERRPNHQAEGLEGPPGAAAPWLCVAGAKGGVGKTMLASNLALLLARAGYRALLVDFDVGTGNVGVHLRVQAPYDLDDVAQGRCSTRDAVVSGPGRLQVLLGRSGQTSLSAATPTEIGSLLNKIRAATDDFDVVVFDTGAGLSASTVCVLEQCDLTLGVTTPEVTAVTDAYALCKVLHARGVRLPQLVINRARNRDEAMRTAAKLNAVTQRFLGEPSKVAGWVCEEPRVADSVCEQRPLALAKPCPGLQDLRSVCAAALAALPAMKRRLTPRAQAAQRVRLRPAEVTSS